jgi:Ala-tRNA(Pro) deacylase
VLDKPQTYRYLDEHGVSYEVTEHEAVFNMAEVAQVNLPYPELDAKNLFLRDDKRRSYHLVTVRGDRHVDLKAFRRAHGLRALSFASADELRDRLGLTPGAVTPLGLLNDDSRSVTLFLDEGLMGGLVGVHPNDNTATVWLAAEDLVRIVREHGNEVQVVAL